MPNRFVIFGSGGHAKVVVESVRAAQSGATVVMVDDDPQALGRKVLGITVEGDRSWLAEHWPEAVVVPAIGNNRVRSELVHWLLTNGRPLGIVLDPKAIVSPSAEIGGGSFLAPGAIVNAEAVLGMGVIINTAASIDHDCQIGAGAHIAPGVHLCGGVRVGERTLVGVGATVIPGISIGDDAIIGAGSVVVRDVADGARVRGSPARPW
jgi:sugar O-acyltransferase (sialic acid O-acetyltransferase NeuD family)